MSPVRAPYTGATVVIETHNEEWPRAKGTANAASQVGCAFVLVVQLVDELHRERKWSRTDTA